MSHLDPELTTTSTTPEEAPCGCKGELHRHQCGLVGRVMFYDRQRPDTTPEETTP